jgi:hypothetical protein
VDDEDYELDTYRLGGGASVSSCGRATGAVSRNRFPVERSNMFSEKVAAAAWRWSHVAELAPDHRAACHVAARRVGRPEATVTEGTA